MFHPVLYLIKQQEDSMNKKLFLISEILFYLFSKIAFGQVYGYLHCMLTESVVPYSFVPNSVKVQIIKTIALEIFIFLCVSIIYYIFTHRIGLLFIYTWIELIFYCILITSWFGYNNDGLDFLGVGIFNFGLIIYKLALFALLAIIWLIKLYFTKRKSGE